MSTLRNLGETTDDQGFKCERLEDTVTGQQYLAYSIETLDERVKQNERTVRPHKAWPGRPEVLPQLREK